jgi:hypothetical protein
MGNVNENTGICDGIRGYFEGCAQQKVCALPRKGLMEAKAHSDVWHIPNNPSPMTHIIGNITNTPDIHTPYACHKPLTVYP